jgi:hypothetical protein
MNIKININRKDINMTRTYITNDGARFTAASTVEFLRMLREASRDPRENDLEFRVATARAAALQTGYHVRSLTPDKLVADLIAARLVTVLEWSNEADEEAHGAAWEGARS